MGPEGEKRSASPGLGEGLGRRDERDLERSAVFTEGRGGGGRWEGVRQPSESGTDKGRAEGSSSGPPGPAEFNIACRDGAPDSRLSPFCF